MFVSLPGSFQLFLSISQVYASLGKKYVVYFKMPILADAGAYPSGHILYIQD